MSTLEFTLPDLGEGIESGTVVNVLVAEGDVVSKDQPAVEVEMDKAAAELPCPYAGKVTDLKVKAGDTVTPGQVLFSVDTSAAGAESAAPTPAKAEAPAKAERPAPQPAAKAAPVAVAVSTGSAGRQVYPAGPAVRRLARLLGVELGRVSGSGERGRITAQDIHTFVGKLGSNGTGGGGPAVAPPLPDFSQWGEVEIESITSVRRLTAKAMSRSWSLIPHVTNHDLADITELEAGRKAYKKANPKGARVTMTALVAKACGVALQEFPGVNSSLDLAAGKQIFKKHYHVGIAADTPHGLVVPVLRDVDKKSVLQLAEELTDLSARARDRKLGAAEMRGATFTVTNLGGIGGTSFTPIVNWPQVAILGVSRGRQEYVVTPQGPVPRLLMPLSLSYDHRVVDGALAARFLKRLTELLGSPSTLLYTV